MASWDPAVYERYARHRDRPAQDLLAQLPGDLAPAEVWDLGCGTGRHALQLKTRYPRARVRGLDSSPSMLAAAGELAGEVEWIEGDAATWAPDAPADLVFSNAALQWLPDHASLFPRLVESLAPGGVFAWQMPMSWEAPWHALLRETAAEGPWASALAGVEGVRPLGRPEDYFDWLRPLCDSVDIWSTTYLHALEGEDPLIDWMSGTGLRPFLDRLSDAGLRSAFLDAYRARLTPLYPRRPEGTTLLPFPRLFGVCRRSR